MDNNHYVEKTTKDAPTLANPKPPYSRDLAAVIEGLEDAYSLIDLSVKDRIDTNHLSEKPFRWSENDVGEHMVIVDISGQFGGDCVVELSLNYLNGDTIEFEISKVILLDKDANGCLIIADEQQFENECIINLNRREIITSDQLFRMSRFVYGEFGAPDYKDFWLYALVQFWVFYHPLLQDGRNAALETTH